MSLAVQILIAVGITAWIRIAMDTANRIPRWDKLVLSKIWVSGIVYFLLSMIPFLNFLKTWWWPLVFLIYLATCYKLWQYPNTRLLLIAILPAMLTSMVQDFVQWFVPSISSNYSAIIKTADGMTGAWLIGFGIYALVQNDKERKKRIQEEEKKRKEEARKLELERLVADRTNELTLQKEKLELTLSELKTTQDQLIQSEKMASLGELTAGIAHEIQNPLNFVNNFSQVSTELLDEMKQEITDGNMEEVEDLIVMLSQNLQKIHEHGGRASSIVKGMLQHSRTKNGEKEWTDINALCDEYLRLAYHGIRAKDKTFNVKMETAFDESLSTNQTGQKKIKVIRQDIGRVVLNIITNAFYAVHAKNQKTNSDYQPKVRVETKQGKDLIVISIHDNGNGIPTSILNKIFQPFFTTKPTGQGTGLGLSLSYDIITKGHQGEIKVETEEGVGTSFIIELPLTG